MFTLAGVVRWWLLWFGWSGFG